MQSPSRRALAGWELATCVSVGGTERSSPQSTRCQSVAIMANHESGSDYLLGSADDEHERLIRQAARLAPMTEGLFPRGGNQFRATRAGRRLGSRRCGDAAGKA